MLRNKVPPTEPLKTRPIYHLSFCGSGVQAQLSTVLCARVSPGHNQGVTWATLSSEEPTREESTPRLPQVVGKPHSCGYRTTFLDPWALSPHGHLLL